MNNAKKIRNYFILGHYHDDVTWTNVKITTIIQTNKENYNIFHPPPITITAMTPALIYFGER